MLHNFHPNKLTMMPAKNARYCNMCNDFRPVACFLPTTTPVEDSATVFSQRKANVCNLHDNEEEKERFCKICDEFSPVSNFPLGQKGYFCRKHRYIATQKKAQMKIRNKPGQREKMRLWRQCFNDRIKFNQPFIEIKTHEIEALILKVDPKSTGDYLVVPKDPFLPISPKNIQVVTKQNRKILLKFIAKGDHQAYTAMLLQIALP